MRKIKPSEKDSVALKTWDLRPGAHTAFTEAQINPQLHIAHSAPNVTVLLLVWTDILSSEIYNKWSHPATWQGFLSIIWQTKEHISRIHSGAYQTSTFQQVSNYEGIKIHSQLLQSK